MRKSAIATLRFSTRAGSAWLGAIHHQVPSRMLIADSNRGLATKYLEFWWVAA